MTEKDPNDPLVKQLKQSLDQQASELDTATLSALRQARVHALNALESKQRWFKPNTIWVGGLVTATTLLIALLLVWPGENDISPEMVQGVADIDLLFDDDSIELYEDLDFYLWLEQQESSVNEV
jgi:hypothetical protein